VTVTVRHGDCLDLMRDLPDNSVDAVVCDPPYNLSFMAKPWDAYDGREDAGFAYWLAGLIDGEGHFAIKQHARGTHAPYFALKMRADERGTLERIRRTLGVGVVSDEAHKPNPLAKYVIQDKAGCQRLVDLLDKYPLRAKKQVDYWTWREAVCEWTSRPRGNRWHGQTDNTRLAGQRERLMANRAYTEVPWSGHEFQDWCRLWGAECLRVLKPGGHLLSFGGTRTFHRLAAGLEDAGFEMRDSIAWLYGSGFPKSLDVSKAIDRTAGATRDVVGQSATVTPRRVETASGFNPGQVWRWGDEHWTWDDLPEAGRDYFTKRAATRGQITAPATDDARTWQGWGTALKPAFEPVVVARKPLAGTVAANVLAWGTGALNIDACRIETTDDLNGGGYSGELRRKEQYTSTDTAVGAVPLSRLNRGIGGFVQPAGRWPANVVLDESQAHALDQQSGETSSWMSNTNRAIETEEEVYGKRGAKPVGPQNQYGDSGGASRFYYVAKAPKSERPNVDGIAHPTVKPLTLIRWLVRLITPPGGLVLDPFAGSGTTGEACILEGFDALLLEREADYLPLIAARLDRHATPRVDVEEVDRRYGLSDQPDLFDLLGEEPA
jgi:DNA modification methylase